MSKNAAVPDKEAEVRIRLQRITAMRAEQADLLAYVEEATAEMRGRIVTLTKEKERIEGELALLANATRESEKEAFDQIDALAASIKKMEEQVKAICHALPVEALVESRKFTGFGLCVSVSKASTHKEYKTKEFLLAHPEFRDLEVEGDPLITLQIDPGVMDRLLAMGTLQEKDVTPFTTVVKDKSPSVSITSLDAK